MALTDDLYQKQIELAQRQYDATTALSRQQAQQQSASLAQQLKQGRQDYLSGLQAAQQSSFQRGRNLTNQLSGRGLATSGLMQLGDVQNRLATGQTLSTLGSQNAAVQQAAMQARGNISSSLQGSVESAGLNRLSSQLAADESLYNRQQADLARQDSLKQLVSQMISSGADTEQINALVNYLGNSDVAATDPATLQSLTDVLGTGKSEEQSVIGGTNLGVINNGILTMSNGTTIDVSQFIKDDNRFDIEGVNNAIKEQYANLDNYDKITVRYLTSIGGSGNWGSDITHNKPFGIKTSTGMKWYKTWNEASAAYNELISGK